MNERMLGPGDIVDGRFRIEYLIGEGGYGAVYAARQLATEQLVALKMFFRAEQAPEHALEHEARFLREMLTLAALRHPNVVELIDGAQWAHGAWIALELVRGLTLKQHLKTFGAFSTPEACELMFQVIDAVAAAHAIGVVHRDLKPDNIMIAEGSYGRRRAVVLDFGIAGLLDHARRADYVTLTRQGLVVGSAPYMAPERLRAQALTPQSDVYSWGLILLECLTGQRVASGPTPVEAMAVHFSPDPVPIPASIREPILRSVLARALAKPLDQRFASAIEARDALRLVMPQVSELFEIAQPTCELSTEPELDAAPPPPYDPLMHDPSDRTIRLSLEDVLDD